jgi:hypothetical protein
LIGSKALARRNLLEWGYEMTDRINRIATAADFRQLTRFELLLPSGRKVLMGTPSTKFILLHLPRFQTLAARLAKAATEPPSEQEAAEFEDWMDLLLVDVLVQPRVSFTPKDESEVLPREIPALDRLVIFRTAVGEVGAGGADLAEFRDDAAGTVAPPRANGGDVALPPEPVPGPDGGDGYVPV